MSTPAGIANSQHTHTHERRTCLQCAYALKYFRISDDAADGLQHGRADAHLLADHRVVLVVGVVGVTQAAVRPKLKLHEFVTKLALVASAAAAHTHTHTHAN